MCVFWFVLQPDVLVFGCKQQQLRNFYLKLTVKAKRFLLLVNVVDGFAFICSFDKLLLFVYFLLLCHFVDSFMFVSLKSIFQCFFFFFLASFSLFYAWLFFFSRFYFWFIMYCLFFFSSPFIFYFSHSFFSTSIINNYFFLIDDNYISGYFLYLFFSII